MEKKKKIITNETIHQEMIVNEVLEIGSNTKVQLKDTHNIKIIAEDKNEIECGNHCDIICGDYCNITCGDYCNIKFISDNVIKTGKSCKIEGDYFNEIKTENSCNVKVQNDNEIETGNYCNIEIGETNRIKTEKSCILNGNNENTIKVKNGSRVHIINDCEVTIKGKNIILEVKGENGIIHNRAKGSVIITHSVEGKIKVYKSNKLINEEEIEIENGEISLDYDKRYLTINNS